MLLRVLPASGGSDKGECLPRARITLRDGVTPPNHSRPRSGLDSPLVKHISHPSPFSCDGGGRAPAHGRCAESGPARSILLCRAARTRSIVESPRDRGGVSSREDRLRRWSVRRRSSIGEAPPHPRLWPCHPSSRQCHFLSRISPANPAITATASRLLV